MPAPAAFATQVTARHSGVAGKGRGKAEAGTRAEAGAGAGAGAGARAGAGAGAGAGTGAGAGVGGGAGARAGANWRQSSSACRFFPSGRCDQGSECRFRHELVDKPTQEQVSGGKRKRDEGDSEGGGGGRMRAWPRDDGGSDGGGGGRVCKWMHDKRANDEGGSDGGDSSTVKGGSGGGNGGVSSVNGGGSGGGGGSKWAEKAQKLGVDRKMKAASGGKKQGLTLVHFRACCAHFWWITLGDFIAIQ